MSAAEPSLLSLAERSDINALEDRWLEAIEQADDYRDDMLEALATLTKVGKGEQAAALAWTWLTTEQERAAPDDLLALGRDLFLRCGDNQEMRRELTRLYKEVFADHAGIDTLIDIAGLGGEKTARRALRTLEICLNLKPGDALIARSEENPAVVTEIDIDTWTITLRTARRTMSLDPDQLALKYDPAPANDFRVLVELEPEKLQSLIESDPVAVVVGVLRAHRDQLDSDELEHVLSPRFIPEDQYRKWWTATKRALKRCPNVVVEGKARNILTYHEAGMSLEDEILPQWESADTPERRLMVIESYLREAKSRKHEPEPRMVARLCKDLNKRIKTMRRGAPVEALIEALIMDQLGGKTELPAGETPPAREILEATPDHVRTIRGLAPPRLYVRGLDFLKELHPDDWPQRFAELLPTAPIEACDAIAEALANGGHRDLLTRTVAELVADFTHHIDTVCWLWKGPAVEGIQPMSDRELLLRLLEHLGELNRSDTASADLVRQTRQQIRAALNSDRYRRFKAVIADMDASLASTVRRTVDRLDGLGQVVRIDLMRIVEEIHPGAVAPPPPKVDPWFDDALLFCTAEGRAKREGELNELLLVKIPENARAIGEAAEKGDLSENSEYKFALEERDLLRARVARIQEEMSIASLLTASDVSTDRVSVGTRVTLSPVEGGDPIVVTILGPWESNMDRRIYNYRAPLAVKLKDLAVGEQATLDLGMGEREYRVDAVENALSG